MNTRGFIFFEALAIISLGVAVGLAGQYVYDSMREEEIKKESPIIQEYIDHHMPRYRARRI